MIPITEFPKALLVGLALVSGLNFTSLFYGNFLALQARLDHA